MTLCDLNEPNVLCGCVCTEKQVVDCFKRNPLEDAIRRPHVQIIEKRFVLNMLDIR